MFFNNHLSALYSTWREEVQEEFRGAGEGLRRSSAKGSGRVQLKGSRNGFRSEMQMG